MVGLRKGCAGGGSLVVLRFGALLACRIFMLSRGFGVSFMRLFCVAAFEGSFVLGQFCATPLVSEEPYCLSVLCFGVDG